MSIGSAHHQFQTGDDGNHIPFFATYSNAANRVADTRVTGPRIVPGDTGSAFRALATEDLRKFALQTDDNSIWMLTATTPTWVQLFVGSGLITSVDAERFQIVTSELQLSDNMEATMDAFVGAFLETIRITVTEAGGVVSLNLDQDGGGDLTIIFTDGYFVYDTTPADTVTLTAGTDTAPTINYVYVLQSTKTLTASTAGFPSTEHAPVATVLVQSASGVSTDGVYKLHAWTDHTFESGDNGHLSHINRWVRSQHATWKSGVSQTLTITPNGGSADNVIFTTTAGVAFQLHMHTFPAFSGTPDLFVVNDSVTAFDKIADLNVLLTDALGASMSGRFFSLVIWGAVNQNTGDCKLFVNLPLGSYVNSNGVTQDNDKFAVFAIPSEFRGVGFLISELKLRHQAAASGTWTSIEEVDLRGLLPSLAPGGGATVSEKFLDSLFRIQDDGDDTKEIAFEASAITTGTTRTINMPDTDITLLSLAGQLGGSSASPDVRGIRTTTGPTLLTIGAIADGTILTRSGAAVVGATATSLAGGVIQFGDFSLGTTTTTRYLYPGVLDSGLAHTTEIHFSAPRTGTLRNLHIRCVAGTGAATITFTIRVEASDSSLLVAMSNTATTGADTSNTAAVTQGQRISLSVAKSASVTASQTHVIASLEYAA